MIIDTDLVVTIGDGTITFDEPTLRDWAIIVDMSGKTLEEQADVIIPKIKEIHGLEYKDGSPVTIDSLKAGKFSAKFFMKLIQAWSRAIVDGIKGEAESKNAVTVN